MRLLTEKEENEIAFEDFQFVSNSAVFLRILFEKKKIITIFRKEEENEESKRFDSFRVYDGRNEFCFG
jgi:hypothetical protein